MISLRKQPVLALLLVSMIAVACSGAPAATPLPTAVPPADVAQGGGTWGIGFNTEFPGSFWQEGPHRYAFGIECPSLGTDPLMLGWNEFLVTGEAGLHPGGLYLRVEGLSTEEFIPIYPPGLAVHPTQKTTAVVYLVGVSEAFVNAAPESCDAVFLWDDGNVQNLITTEPFQP